MDTHNIAYCDRSSTKLNTIPSHFNLTRQLFFASYCKIWQRKSRACNLIVTLIVRNLARRSLVIDIWRENTKWINKSDFLFSLSTNLMTKSSIVPTNDPMKGDSFRMWKLFTFRISRSSCFAQIHLSWVTQWRRINRFGSHFLATHNNLELARISWNLFLSNFWHR